MLSMRLLSRPACANYNTDKAKFASFRLQTQNANADAEARGSAGLYLIEERYD